MEPKGFNGKNPRLFWSAFFQIYESARKNRVTTKAGYNQVFENIEKTAKEEANCEKKQWICKSSVGGVVLRILTVISAGVCHVFSWIFDQTSMMMEKIITKSHC